MIKPELSHFQLWYNVHTGLIYETRFSRGELIMYCPKYGGIFINEYLIDNAGDGWEYIGEVFR